MRLRMPPDAAPRTMVEVARHGYECTKPGKLEAYRRARTRALGPELALGGGSGLAINLTAGVELEAAAAARSSSLFVCKSSVWNRRLLRTWRASLT